MTPFASQFALIGERLNTHRESFRTAVVERDAAIVRRETVRQIKAGVTHLDMCASNAPERETGDMLWILEQVMSDVPADVGIVIDSTSAECQAAALIVLKGRAGTILNLNTTDDAVIELSLKHASQHHAGAIVLLGSSGTTGDLDTRAGELRARMASAGIPEARQFLDPQVLPVAFDAQSPRGVLETVRGIREQWPQARIVAGLSNVSFNLPKRQLLNTVYLAMLMGSGLDAVMCDPCCGALRETLFAAQALMGQDDFMATYLSEFAPGS